MQQQTPGAPAAPRRRRLAWLAVAVAAVGYGLDQLTKWVVESTMELGDSIPVIPGLLHWQFHLNPGAAFSIGTDVTWLFTIIQAGVVLYVAYLLRNVASPVWAVALGALLGGAAGNLTDRLFREPGFGLGHVVDFIAVRHFAIFNIADSLVVCSMAVICVLIFRGLRMDGTRERDDADAGDGASADGGPAGGARP